MKQPETPGTIPAALAEVERQIAEATAAKKCHGCGCLHQTVETLAGTGAGKSVLAEALARARETFVPKKYDCLGCQICYPAIAANVFSEAFPDEGASLDLCPTEEPAKRQGWPPLPGDYLVLRYRAPVAVCTLNSNGLAHELAMRSHLGLAIVGKLRTENLGVERLIRNIVANPHIRFLVLCGEDTRQAIGHLPGQSLAALFTSGIDAMGRILGASGKRPILKNVAADQVRLFLEQVELVMAIGEDNVDRLVELVAGCAGRDPGPYLGTAPEWSVPVIDAHEPDRLIGDPSGFFVVYPDPVRSRLVVEHYTNAGVLDITIEGTTPSSVAAEAISRQLISRLDHAAYLGRELARAERSLQTGESYTQDRAPGELKLDAASETCGCGAECEG